MRPYEVMVILDPTLDERTVAPSLETFLNVIRKDGPASFRTEPRPLFDCAVTPSRHLPSTRTNTAVSSSPRILPATVNELYIPLSRYFTQQK